MSEEVPGGNELKELKIRLCASAGQCETLEGISLGKVKQNRAGRWPTSYTGWRKWKNKLKWWKE